MSPVQPCWALKISQFDSMGNGKLVTTLIEQSSKSQTLKYNMLSYVVQTLVEISFKSLRTEIWKNELTWTDPTKENSPSDIGGPWPFQEIDALAATKRYTAWISQPWCHHGPSSSVDAKAKAADAASGAFPRLVRHQKALSVRSIIAVDADSDARQGHHRYTHGLSSRLQTSRQPKRINTHSDVMIASNQKPCNHCPIQVNDWVSHHQFVAKVPASVQKQINWHDNELSTKSRGTSGIQSMKTAAWKQMQAAWKQLQPSYLLPVGQPIRNKAAIQWSCHSRGHDLINLIFVCFFEIILNSSFVFLKSSCIFWILFELSPVNRHVSFQFGKKQPVALSSCNPLLRFIEGPGQSRIEN